MEAGANDFFDWDRLDAVIEGDHDFARELIQVYLRDTAALVDALEEALVAVDLESAMPKAHTLKGASANVGAAQLRDLAASMEKALHADAMGVANTLMPEIRHAYDRVHQALHKFIAGLPE